VKRQPAAEVSGDSLFQSAATTANNSQMTA